MYIKYCFNRESNWKNYMHKYTIKPSKKQRAGFLHYFLALILRERASIYMFPWVRNVVHEIQKRSVSFSCSTIHVYLNMWYKFRLMSRLWERLFIKIHKSVYSIDFIKCVILSIKYLDASKYYKKNIYFYKSKAPKRVLHS